MNSPHVSEPQADPFDIMLAKAALRKVMEILERRGILKSDHPKLALSIHEARTTEAETFDGPAVSEKRDPFDPKNWGV
jgi:hypothetical protein